MLSKHRTITALDEMDQKGRLLHAVNGVAEILLTTEEEKFESSLRESMALMASCLEVDRIYIWQNIMMNDSLNYIQQFEWLSSAETAAKTVGSKTGFSYRESIPEWEKVFLKGDCVNGPLSSLSQTEQQRLEPYGIKSILVIPIYLQNLFWGFVSFDDCLRERTFTEDEVSILRSASLMLASAMDRYETAARMREADERVKLMLDATPLCCSLWDHNINLIDCNEAVVHFYGLKDKREYIDKFLEFSPEFQPDGRPSKEQALEYIAATFREGKRFVFEWTHQMPDGAAVPVEVTLVRIKRGDDFIVAGYTRDLREYKRMMADIEEAVERAQAASKAKSAFLARVSHEVRTPMNVISGMTELMLREDIPPAIYEHALSIKHAGNDMLSLVNDVLDFSKIEAGSLDIVSAEYSLTSLVNNILIIIRMRASEKPILLTANIDCNIPNRLIGDEARIRQILLNMLDNAVKYTNEGFVSLTMSGEIQDDEIILTAEIADSGVGIKEEFMEKLFEEFARADGDRNRRVQGTGLGLAISKSLCQAMGGTISVRSEYGVGSTFSITLSQKIKSHAEKFACVSDPGSKQVLLYEMRPIYAESIIRSFTDLGVRCTLVEDPKELYEELKRRYYPFIFASSLLSESVGRIIDELKLDTTLVLLMEFGEAPALHNVRTIATPVHAASIANILDDLEDSVFYSENGRENVRFIAPAANILVVDDLNTNLKVTQGLMLPYQMTVDICSSGEEAIENVQQKHYDIIFMDHMMPGMDGLEATARIRALVDASGYYQQVPIIALTANAVSGVKEMFLRCGMNDFLAKPIDVSKLHLLLEKWIPAEKKEKFKRSRILKASPLDIIPWQIQIEGVDVHEGINITGGSVDGYLKTLALFQIDATDRIDKIRNCAEQNDINLYTIYVHALKSATANIGAWEVSDRFKILEMAGKRSDAQFIRENTERILEDLEALLRNIQTVLAQNQGEPQKETDPEFLKSELLKLKEALRSRDAGRIDDILTTLNTVSANQQTEEMLKQISRCILLINYPEASALIERMLG